MSNIIIFSTSPRKGGNSEILAEKFLEGAIASGNKAEIIYFRDLDIKFCTGCMYCLNKMACTQNDSMNALYQKLHESDAIVFATPVYYYSVSGQLKTLIDRLNPLYDKGNKFKKIYALMTAAENEEHTFDGTLTAIQGFVDCHEGVEITGCVRGGGVSDKGDILSTNYPTQALEMGKSV